MSRCAFTLEARSDLQQIHDYIAQGSPTNALRFVDRLEDHPRMGIARPEFGQDHRSFYVPGTRYVIIYRPTSNGVEIIHVRHGSQELRRLFE